jgi:hypothetical protein
MSEQNVEVVRQPIRSEIPFATMARRLARLGLLLATTACGLLMLSTAAWGAVRLGPDTSATPDGNTGCGADACTFVNRSGPAGVIVAAPFDGVLVRWAIVTSSSTQTWRLRTVREMVPGMFIATGGGSAEGVAPGAERSFATQLSIRGGDLIAVDGPASAAAPLAFRSGGGTNSRFNPPLLEGDPARSPTANGSGFLGMVSAQLEPDEDRDAFGDETQDKCLGTAGTANGCPSTVTIDKLKQKGDSKLKVSATIPGAGSLKVGSASDPALASAAAKKKSLRAVTKTLTATTKQQVKLTLRLTKSAIGKLDEAGKLKVKVKAVYTPVGGPAGSQTKKKKLKT